MHMEQSSSWGSDRGNVSDLLKHMVVADSIGVMMSASEKKMMSNVGTAFALGVASHAVMDLAEPDYTVNWFDAHQLGLSGLPPHSTGIQNRTDHH